jgi:ketosteroid isomerase-like protein
MSQENVEVVRGHLDAFNDNDAPRSLSAVDPYVVVDRSRVGAVDSTVIYGREALVEAVRRQLGAFEEYALEVEGLTDLGSGVILALLTEAGRGKGSGVPVRRSFAYLYTLIDGKIVRITQFLSEKQALEAAGLLG